MGTLSVAAERNLWISAQGIHISVSMLQCFRLNGVGHGVSG